MRSMAVYAAWALGFLMWVCNWDVRGVSFFILCGTCEKGRTSDKGLHFPLHVRWSMTYNGSYAIISSDM